MYVTLLRAMLCLCTADQPTLIIVTAAPGFEARVSNHYRHMFRHKQSSSHRASHRAKALARPSSHGAPAQYYPPGTQMQIKPVCGKSASGMARLALSAGRDKQFQE